MKSFAISQQKGGVGKTTNTINIAGALAHRGHQVLAIDADPQGYLTNTLGFREAYQSDPPSLYDAIKTPHDHDAADLVVAHAEFDVLPANIDMFQLEQDLIASGRRPRQRFGDVLDQLQDYDYVLIDAPPSLGPINDNVLLAAEDIIIPVEADDSSVLAIEHLLNQIESLERGYDVDIRERAILISNVNYPWTTSKPTPSPGSRTRLTAAHQSSKFATGLLSSVRWALVAPSSARTPRRRT